MAEVTNETSMNRKTPSSKFKNSSRSRRTLGDYTILKVKLFFVQMKACVKILLSFNLKNEKILV